MASCQMLGDIIVIESRPFSRAEKLRIGDMILLAGEPCLVIGASGQLFHGIVIMAKHVDITSRLNARVNYLVMLDDGRITTTITAGDMAKP